VLGLLAQQDGITQHELCRRASSDPNTIRAKLILMETYGLVARRPHPTDGRARSVTLTHKGRQVYDRLSATIKPLQNHLSALFQDREAESLVQLLGRISKAMVQLEPQRRGRSHPPIVKTKRFVKGEKR
jgi:DNA-binding MarR family transcriptional regulator